MGERPKPPIVGLTLLISHGNLRVANMMKQGSKLMKKIAALAALLLAGVSVSPAQTNLFTNETKIFASDATTNKFFGYPVKYGFTTTNVMLVGSLDTNNGAVYNFHFLASNW